MATAFSANLQEAATATGNGDALKVIGAALVLFDLSITVGTATVTFEATGNSGTYVALPVTDISTGTTATTASASGIYRADVRGLSFVRARISAIAGGGVVSVWAVSIDAPGAIDTGGGSGTLSIGKVEDAAAASGDTGVAILGRRSGGAAAALTSDDGDYSHIAVNPIGSLMISASQYPATTGSDGHAGMVGLGRPNQLAVSQDPTPLYVATGSYNGTTMDRDRNNINVTLLASAARTATPTKVDQTNYNARGIHIVIDVTAVAATPSVVVTLQGKDAVSGKYYTLLASAAIVGTGTTVLKVFPGATAAANAAANDILPRTFAIDCVHADADSITYSVGYSLIL